jgi:ketosteroid isomerase-like protein
MADIQETQPMPLVRLSLTILLAFLSTTHPAPSADNDRLALEKTSAAIRAAFSNGDVATAMRYHHPEVKKALAFNKLLIGRDAVAADLQSTLTQFHLEFVQNNVESLLIEQDVAVEQTLFTIKGTPLYGGDPFLFKGRSMIVYVRYKESPTGWASIREIIQTAN